MGNPPGLVSCRGDHLITHGFDNFYGQGEQAVQEHRNECKGDELPQPAFKNILGRLKEIQQDKEGCDAEQYRYGKFREHHQECDVHDRQIW